MNEMNGLDWVNGMKETLDVRREINSLEINRGYAYLIEMILLHCTLIASWHSIFHVQHTTSSTYKVYTLLRCRYSGYYHWMFNGT